MISAFSIVSAVLLYSLMLVVVGIMRRVTPFLKRGGVSVSLLLVGFAALRLVLPFEIPLAFAFRSWNLLGEFQRYVRTNADAMKTFFVVWGIGAVGFVGWSIYGLRRAYKQCRSYVVVEDETVQEIARRNAVPCPVVVSPDVEVPYVAGFFRHTIYLPVMDLQEGRLELAILHEVQHIRSHDALIKLFFGLTAAVMWWNPIAHLFRNEIDALLEMRCDGRVVKGMSEQGKMEYGAMLKDIAGMVVRRREGRRPVLNESWLVKGKDRVMRQRLKVVIRRETGRSARMMCFVAQCMVVVLFCASYLVVIQGAGAPPEECFQNDSRTYYRENYDGSEIGEEIYGVFIFKGSDGRYQLFINYEFSRYLAEDEVVSDQYKNLHIFEENRQR